MNAFLLSLGIALVLGLSAALAAPFFIDWSSQRHFLEVRAGEILGRTVEFAGPLEVRLVPFPRLTARNVRIGGPDAHDEGAEQMVIRAALTPLLSGELQITELVLTRPRLSVSIDDDGGVSWAPGSGGRTLPVPPERTRLERVEIIEGTLVIDDALGDAPMEVTGLNMSGSAGSLAGPFRFEGGGVVDGRRYTLRIGTGRLQESGALRFTASVVPADRPLTLELDGTLELPADGAPRYRGSAIIAQPAVSDRLLPWRVEGQVSATTREVAFDSLGVSIGQETERLTLEGAATLALGSEPRFDVALRSRQLDFDRAYGGGVDEPAAPGTALARVGELLQSTVHLYPGSLSLEVGSIVLAGNLLENVAADLELRDGSWRIVEANAQGPGRTQARFSGSLDDAEAGGGLAGQLQLESRQSGALTGWLFGPDARVPGLGAVAGRLAVAAELAVNGDGIEFTDLQVETGDTRLTGEIAYWNGTQSERSGLVARIETDQFSLDGLRGSTSAPTVASLLGLLADTDVDLAVDAGVLSVGAVELNDVTMVVALSDGDMRIDRLRIGDLGGARIDGHGAIADLATVPSGSLALDLEADSLAAVAEALAALELHAAADAVKARSHVLVPARLAVSIEAARTDDEAGRADLKLSGTAGATSVDLGVRFAGRVDHPLEGDVAVHFEAVNEEGGQLVEQLGLFARTDGDAPGRIAISAEGRPDSAMAYSLSAAGMGLEGNAGGDLRLTRRGGRELSGTFAVDVADPTVLLDAAGLVLPSAGDGPIRVAGRLSSTDDVWRLSNLAIRGGAVRARGALSLDLGGSAPAADATLEVNRLSLPWLLAALLGADAFDASQLGDGEAVWSQEAVVPLDTGGWRTRLRVTAPQLDLGRGFTASRGSLDLRLSPARFAVENIEGALLGGRMAGSLEMTTLEGAVQLEGRFDLDELRLEEVAWRNGGRPLAAGTLSASATISGGGRSLLGLVSTLAGEGSLRIENGVIRRMNPRAFDHIVRAADAELELEEDEVRRVFAGHLDAGSLIFERAEGSFSLAGGMVRTRNIRLDGSELESFASGTIDLARLQVDSEWSLRVDAPDGEGGTREAAIMFSGPLAAPSRSIDVAPLLGYLTVRAFEQEVQRIEELQAELGLQEWRRHELLRFDREEARIEREREDRRLAEEQEAEEAAEDDSAGGEAAAPDEISGGDSEGDAEDAVAEDATSEEAVTEEEVETPLIDFESMVRDALRDPSRQEQDVPPAGQDTPQPAPGQPINIVPPFAGVDSPPTQ